MPLIPEIPNPIPSDALKPGCPIKGLPLPNFLGCDTQIDLGNNVRVNSFSIALMPDNQVVIAVSSVAANDGTPTTDPVQLAQRSASQIILYTSVSGKIHASQVLCGNVVNPTEGSVPYCDTSTEAMYVDISVPSSIWDDSSYSQLFILDGPMAGGNFSIFSRPTANIWRIFALTPVVAAPGAFHFIATNPTGDISKSVFNDGFALPYITVNGLPVSAVNPQVAVNASVLPTSKSPIAYVIAEAPVNGTYQLFFFASTSGGSNFGWEQLTFDGENRNAKIKCDSTGNLHAIWESMRCDTKQVYYGALGPSSRNIINEAFASVIDKQASQSGGSLNPLATFGSPIALNLRDENEYGAFVGPMWFARSENSGTSTIVNDDAINVSGNPDKDVFSAFGCLNRDNLGLPFSIFFDQLSYQVSFTANIEPSGTSVLTEQEINDSYASFKSNFVAIQGGGTTNVNLYSRSGYDFTIANPVRYYEDFIPIVGSYAGTGVCNNYVASSRPSKLRHFMIGAVPEKVRFFATSEQTNTVYEEVQYTGYFKLAVVFETAGNLSNPSLAVQKSHTASLIGNPITFGSTHNYNVAVYYAHLTSEAVGTRVNDSSLNPSDDFNFTGQIVLAVDGTIYGAQNFVPDFSDEQIYFEIGFGCPTPSGWAVDAPLPFNAHVFNNQFTTIAFTNIAVGPQTMVADPILTHFSRRDRDTSLMFVDSFVDVLNTQSSATELGLTSEEYYASLGLTRASVSFNQIPITFLSKNMAPSLAIDGCDRPHVAYQSFRDGHWDIYYTASYDQGNPFRFDTRITNTPSESIMPSIAVDGSGKRLIAWHDNRNGNYQIYAARSNVALGCNMCNPIVGAVDVDEYNSTICECYFPYNGESGTYHFTLSFYTDPETQNLYKTISSSSDIAGWKVNGEPFDYAGGVVTDGSIVSYDASGENYLSGKVLYVRSYAVDVETETIEPTQTDPTVFYCPIDQYNRCDIPCSYTNYSGEPEDVHFRVIVYSDSAYTKAVLSSDTSIDQNGWSIGNDEFPSSGITVDNFSGATVYYDPQFLPVELYNQQNASSPTGLLCDVTYYVESQVKIGSEYTTLETFSITCNCDSGTGKWNVDRQSSLWICSGQGYGDIRITQTDRDSLFPQAVGSQDGAIYIVWEDQRYGYGTNLAPTLTPSIFYAVWDATKDQFTCSAQGLYDHRLNNDARYYKPQVVLTSLQYPSFFYQSDTDVFTRNCTLYLPPMPAPVLTQSDQGYFNENQLPLTVDDLKCLNLAVAHDSVVRLYHENSEQPVPLVNNCFVNLDVIGPPGSYSIRLKNESDTDWSDWLSVLAKLPDYPPTANANFPDRGDGSQRAILEGYFTGEDRFRIPWILSPGSGNKIVYAQVLTYNGVSPTISTNVIASYDDLRYTVQFYADSAYSQPLPQYNGFPVVSTYSLADGTTIQSNDVSSIQTGEKIISTIYVEVVFLDKWKLQQAQSLLGIQKYSSLGGINFDVVQQGRQRQLANPLTQISDTIFRGSFTVSPSDGYLSVDGLGVVVVNVPTPCETSLGIVDPGCDNPSLLTPQEIQQQQQVNTNAKVITSELFYQQYNSEVDCSFTSVSCNDGIYPNDLVDDTFAPYYSGPLNCSVPDFFLPQAAEIGFIKGTNTGEELNVYFRESPAYYMDFTDPRITKLLFGVKSELTGILLMIPADQSVTTSIGTDGTITYTTPANPIVIGSTSATYAYAQSNTPATYATVAKTITDGTLIYSIPNGDTTPGGEIANFAANGFLTLDLRTSQKITTTTLNTAGLLSDNILRWKFIHICTGFGYACIKDMGCGSGCTLPPLPPSEMHAEGAGLTSIYVGWSISSGADGYVLERSIGSAGPYTEIAIVTNDGYYDVDLDQETEYCYKVKAFNACGYSNYIGPVCSITGCTPPNTITGFNATVAGDTEIDLSWHAQTNVDYWIVQRRINGTLPYTFSTNVDGGLSGYSDTGLDRGTCYDYLFTAHNGCGSQQTALSDICTTCTTPSVVTGIAITNASPTSLILSWETSAAADYYEIYRDVNGGGFSYLTTITSPTVTYTDTIVSGSTYCYYIIATNVCGSSEPSLHLCNGTPPCCSPEQTFSFSVPMTAESAFCFNNPATALPYWPESIHLLVYSDDGHIDLTNATEIKFNPGATLNGILCMIPTDAFIDAGTFSVELDIYTQAATFLFPNNAIFFYDTQGYFIYDLKDWHKGTGTKYLSNFTEHILTIPQGDTSNYGTGHATDLAAAGATVYSFSDPIPKSVLQSLGYVDSFGVCNFKLALIFAGISEVNVSITCDGDGNCVEPPACLESAIPAAPSGLTVSNNIDGNVLNWIDNSGGTSSYFEIQRQENGGPFLDYDFVNGNATTYHDLVVVDGDTYCYQVVALGCIYNNAYLRSSPSNQVCLSDSCPTDCSVCCSQYIVTVTGALALNGTYTLNAIGNCNWFGTSETTYINKDETGLKWVLSVGTPFCTMTWHALCTGCPPTEGWQYISGNCGGTPVLAIELGTCLTSSSSSGSCGFSLSVAGGNEGYDQYIDISDAFTYYSRARFVFTANTLLIPDRITVTTARGSVVFDTGCAGTNGNDVGTFDLVIADSPLHIVVQPNCNDTTNTGWYFTCNCISLDCTPNQALAPYDSILTPKNDCANFPDVLYMNYTVESDTYACPSSSSGSNTAELVYQGSCTWESTGSPAWKLVGWVTSQTWTLSLGTGGSVWTGTLSGNNTPVGIYSRTSGCDITQIRAISAQCTTCPTDGSTCCQYIEVGVTSDTTACNGLWVLAQYDNQAFWSTINGSKPDSSDSTSEMVLFCNGYNWVLALLDTSGLDLAHMTAAELQTLTANELQLLLGVSGSGKTFEFTSVLTNCPSLASDAWTKVSDTCDGTVLTLDCVSGPIVPMGSSSSSGLPCELILVGSADLTSGIANNALLVPALAGQRGAFWYSEMQNLNNPFDVSITFTINDGSYYDWPIVGSGYGADGLAFVVAYTAGPLDTLIGVAGQGIGYDNLSNAIAVECDTFQDLAPYNLVQVSDPNNNHVSLQTCVEPVIATTTTGCSSNTVVPSIASSTISYFNSSYNYPAGTYVISYCTGAMKISPSLGWMAYNNYRIVYNNGTATHYLPPNNTNYPTQLECELDNAGAKFTINHTGGKIGVYLELTAYGSTVSGTPNPTFGLDSQTSSYVYGGPLLSDTVTSKGHFTPSITMTDGNPHTLRVVWNPTLNQVQVYMDGTLGMTVPINIRTWIAETTAYFGITGATGAAWENEYISSFIINGVDQMAICESPDSLPYSSSSSSCPLLDTFTRANSSTLGHATSGQLWQPDSVYSGTWGEFAIVSNQSQYQSSTGSTNLDYIDSGISGGMDVKCSFSMSTTYSASHYGVAGIGAGFNVPTESTSDYIVLDLLRYIGGPSSNYLVLTIGTTSSGGGSFGPVTVPIDPTFTLEIKMCNGYVTCYYNNTQVFNQPADLTVFGSIALLKAAGGAYYSGGGITSSNFQVCPCP